MAGTFKGYILEAAILQIKACLSEPLINHFWALACVLSIKSRACTCAAVCFYICFEFKEQPGFPCKQEEQTKRNIVFSLLPVV